MRLDKLPWTSPNTSSYWDVACVGKITIWRANTKHPDHRGYIIIIPGRYYGCNASNMATPEHVLDAISAQAILYHLLSTGAHQPVTPKGND